MELSERYIQQLESEGFANVYEWQDPAGTVYEAHKHRGKTVMWLTDGSIELTVGDKIVHLETGDRYDVPPETKHSAKVGQSGWIAIIAEEIEED